MSDRHARSGTAIAVIAVVALATLAIAPGYGDESLPILGENLKPLSKRFNAASDRARFLAILSPT